MVLNRDSKTVRWAYLFEDRSFFSRRYTSLCAIFWRCVLLTPLKLFGVTCAVGWLGMILFLIGKFIYFHPHTSEAVGGTICLWLLGLYLNERRYGQGKTTFGSTVRDYPIVQGALAIKKQICPLVEIE